MKHRTGVGWFLLFAFLAVIVFMQMWTYSVQHRLEKTLDGLAEEISSVTGGDTVTAQEGQFEEYPGDEGDWLVWAYRVEPKTLNQINADADIYSRWITTPYILEPLLDYDYDTLELKPYLAESVDVSEDGLEVTFTLRDDVYFSDGVPVTSDDVVFTFDTIMNPQIDAATVAQMYTDVASVEKVNERVVKFHMKRAFFKTLDNLSFSDVGIYPKHIYEFDDPAEFNGRLSEPVGSGPYVFDGWEKGHQIVLRRNDNYWGAKPKLRKVIYRFITNSVACLQALRSGQVDIVIPEPDQFSELNEDEQFKRDFYCLQYYEPRIPFFYIGWNIDTPYFSDRRVRLAMTHITNRNEIIERLVRGSGRLVTGPFYRDSKQNDPNIQPWPYDPGRAKELLDEAGWVDSDGDGIRDKDGIALRFKFMYSADNVLYQRLAKLLKDEAAAIGVEVVPDPYEWSVLIPMLTDRQFESMVMGWGGDMIDDPYQIFHSSQIENRGSNYVGFRNALADKLMVEARGTMDAKKRNRIFHEIQQILHDEQPYTFLFERPEMRLLDKRFENVKIHAKGPNWLEWYVPKDKQKYD